MNTALAFIAIGLGRQAIVIHRAVAEWQEVKERYRSAARFQAGWRLLASAAIAILLALQFAVDRQLVTLPEDNSFVGDVLGNYALWMLIVISAAEPRMRCKRRAGTKPSSALMALPMWIGISLFGLYVVLDRSMITFLVHLGCHGVDSTLRYTGNRYHLLTVQQQTWFVFHAAGAVACAACGSALVWRLLRRTRRETGELQVWQLCLAIALLLTAVIHDWWFYRYGYSDVSPDLAIAGIGSSWYQRLGGVILCILLAAVGATYFEKTTKRGTTESTELLLYLPPAAESWPVILLLLIVAAYFLYGLVENVWDPTLGLEIIPFILVYPDTAFIAATGVYSLRLARLRWNGRLPCALSIASFDARAFVSAFVVLLALLAIAIPTLAMFSLSFWLGPWYRW